MRRIAMAFLGILLVAVIGIYFITKSANETTPVDTNSLRAVELYQEDVSTEAYKRIRAYFLVPVDFTQEEISEHAKAYIEMMKAEHSDISVLTLWYYDDEAYLHDTPVATVRWSPYGRYHNLDNVKIGDYSKHILTIDYSIYNSDYELDEEEKHLYVVLQNYSKGQTGKYLGPFNGSVNNPEWPSEDMPVYEHIAEEYQTTVERLMEIRIKATMRRLSEE